MLTMCSFIREQVAVELRNAYHIDGLDRIKVIRDRETSMWKWKSTWRVCTVLTWYCVQQSCRGN